MTIKQLSIFIENKSGTLIRVLDLLSRANIQIIASTIADTQDYGIYRVLCSAPGEAYLILKDNGINVQLADVMAITIDDEPGRAALAVKALSDGLRIDLVDTPLRVTNIKPGMVETNFSVIRFRGDKEKADNVYKGIRPLTGEDIAEVAYFAASAPEYMQIAEVLVMPTNQATGTIAYKK